MAPYDAGAHVEFTSAARARASAAAAWWQENRPAAPMLFEKS